MQCGYKALLKYFKRISTMYKVKYFNYFLKNFKIEVEG